MPTKTKLCGKCQEVSINDSNPEFRSLAGENNEAPNRRGIYWVARLNWAVEDILPDLPALNTSALKGCGFCEFLRETILYRAQDRADDDLASFLAGRDKCEVGIELEYHWTRPKFIGNSNVASRASRIITLTAIVEESLSGEGVRDGDLATLYFTFLVEACENQVAVSDWLAIPIETSNPDRFSVASVSWARRYLDSCATGHSHEQGAENFLPTRLLDVRNEPVRLITTEVSTDGPKCETSLPSPQQIRYAALSYSWGGTQQTLTTHNNIDRRKAAITTEERSSVLRDAIEITRLLLLDYLWIDALCIIQEDKHDWEHQSTKIGRIYQEAFVTITTPSSSSSQCGFRYTTRPKLFLPFTSRANDEVAGQLAMRFLRSGQHNPLYPFEPSTIIYSEVDESHWASRAWTFQESCLARRKLIFSPSDMFIQCQESTIFKCGWTIKNMHISKDDVERDDWRSIVESYSSRHGISRVTDVLPAISGIADLYRKNRGFHTEEYMAGLWLSELPFQLLWHVHDPRDIKPSSLGALCDLFVHSPAGISPSWSWTGKGRVEFKPHEGSVTSFKRACKILAWTRVTGKNPFGEVEIGTIQITGRVVTSELILERSVDGSILSMRSWTWTSKGGHPWKFHLDWNPREDQIHLKNVNMVLLGIGTTGRSKKKVYFGILICETGNRITSERFVRIGFFMSHFSRDYSSTSARLFFTTYPVRTIEID